MHVVQSVDSVFTSNTYIISDDDSGWIWLIDAGDIDGVLKLLSKDIIVRVVFLTHVHYDVPVTVR